MKAGREIEIKLEVRDPRALKRSLARLDFRRVEARHFESNCLLDFPNLRLRQAQLLLRLRWKRGKCLLTFKGAPSRSRHYKVRTEMEMEVEDGGGLREILESAGLREVFRYDKYRTQYAPASGRQKMARQDGSAGRGAKRRAPERCELAYDETPIGNYVELEGPPEWIDEVARRLGCQRSDYITLSYAALYHQKCREQGKKPANMVFPARRSGGSRNGGAAGE
jgi:adenylate cyclase class 2